ncbi:disintegrin and metalloproteinase domain-containing protein 12-like isoform X4 [Poeciliopsis prolifica]|uniref:disintegrin and metalloproteinase domain-containing protein 12-like isoform X4 n=1 Tax=Poeciliopsis prolifica TaxID=188132 RepID=UPI0024135478|nr:disintegrin and metalloproteinase domain-containing protein 12-like isoform X4 [Poeciliopsis prolifica]
MTIQSKRRLKFILTALQTLTVCWLMCDKVHSAEGNLLGVVVENEPTAKWKHFETTVPLQLVGQEWKPVSKLTSQSHPVSLKLSVVVEGEQLVLALEKNEGLFAGNYMETHYLEDGSAVTGPPNFTANCYYHGKVEGHLESDVSLSTCAGIRGFIYLGGRSYMLEACANCPDGIHWIYSAEHLSFVPGTCGHGFNVSHPVLHTDSSPFKAFSTRHKRHLQTTTKYVELIIVADNREFQKQGKDIDKVKQRLAEIANYVDKFYRALNIRVALVGLEVWSDVDKCPITQDPFTTLHEFLDWRKVKLLPQKPHDNAQLISGVYFQGTTIGMAPIMSMCTAEQSGGIVMDHSDNPLGAAVTLAHELGHNFGMNHDTPERGCGCRVTVDRGGCIMTPSTGYPFPTVFSSCSKKDLMASFEKGVGMCLFNMPELKVLYGGQKCGNGYVEEGEECDCGEVEECMNPCCNATTCTLKGDAVCAHGHCCQDCQLKPAGTPCREPSNSCDLPEFCTGSSPHCPANVYLHDGHSCLNVDGYCYNGICQTHEQQCITLWGQGAKPAPGICFERVNSAGDPYGNCGKDSKGSFAKCEARDAKCGKIQCQGGANRPVIGTNAVSIETNIPLQEGGRILCRGTHVYLGDDMPDPGLVLTGTKCGDGMMCLNRRCQNVSVFSVHECAAKCSGRGVCNSNKNCHCEAHWAPPFCDKAGFGGSVDSGPIRLADSRNLAVGILVALLTVLVAALIICVKRKTLIGLLITSKKDQMEKLRSENAPVNGPSAPKQHLSSPTRPAPPLPHSATIFKSPQRASDAAPPSVPYPSHSLHRLPQCPPVHLSHPVPLSLTLSLTPGPRQPRPPAPPPHRAPLPHTHMAPRGTSFHSMSHHNSCRMVMELEKPSPPQKPLPADPRTSRLVRSPSGVQSSTLVRGSSAMCGPAAAAGASRPARHVPRPNKPSPKHPPTLPKPCIIANVRYSS